MSLVLSLFPGIGLLDMAFELEGFCVVRGPDVIWGGDVLRFHPPAGKFDGVIGGPPCQLFSDLKKANPRAGRHGNMIPEFERVVSESCPRWFVMENVKRAPLPNVAGYITRDVLLNNRWLGEKQNRVRRFSFGTAGGISLKPFIELAVFENPKYETAVIAGHDDYISRRGWNAPARPFAYQCELQGLPSDFLNDSPLTAHGKKRVVGNGVPLPMGRAIARAVKEAIGIDPPR